MTLTKTNLNAALQLSRWGIPCFPCGPDKRPKVKWLSSATTDRQIIRQWWRQFPNAIPAMPTGSKSGLSVIDLDIKKGQNGVNEYKRQGFKLADAGAVVQTGGGGLHLYFSHPDGLRNSQSRLGAGIDVRAEGGYVICPGAESAAGAYKVLEGQIDTIELLGPRPPKEILKRLSGSSERSSVVSTVNRSEIRDALSYIPCDGNREGWIRVLMALHSSFEGAPQGLELAKEWSADYPDYNPIEVDEQWASFKHITDGGITAATLFREARRCGWNPVSAEDFDDIEDDDVSEKKGPIDALNQRYAVVRLGGGTAIADFRENGDIEFLSSTAFRELYANQLHGNKPLGTAWIAHPKRRTFLDGVTFDPSKRSSASYLNLFRGFATQPDLNAGYGLIYDHVVEVLAAGNRQHADYIFSWLAHIVQRPAEKPGVALVLKGEKGVGKDTIAEIMKGVVGRRHSAHVTSTQRLTARFNAAFSTALLIHVEEAVWGGQHDAKGTIQSLITCPSIPLERKHIDTVEVDNYSRLLFTTNESWAIPATADERRYAVFQVSSVRRGDRKYFADLYRQIESGGLAGFLSFLISWNKPEYIDLRDPPQTYGLMEQKLSGLKGVERWWYEFLCDGDFPTNESSGSFATPDQGNDWCDGPHSISREMLRDTYKCWLREMRFQGDPKGPSEFGEALHRLCPDVESFRPKENGKRTWKYRVPALSECRNAFVRSMGGRQEDMHWEY